MKLSVFVVTYNQEQYIRQCLDSILSQQVNFDYEVVIGDDCSTDSTGVICDEYAAKYTNLHVSHHKKNLGHVKNWGFVLQHCTGEYVAMVEGDDYWTDPHKLQMQVDFLDSHKDYYLSFHKVDLLYEQSNHPQETIFSQLEEREYSIREIYDTWTVLTSSVVFRNKIGPVEFPKNIFFSDIYLFLTIMQYGRAWCHDIHGVAYRRHAGNQSSSQSIRLAIRLYKQYCAMSHYFPSLQDITDANKRQYLHDIAYNYVHEPSALPYMFLYMTQHPSKALSLKYWRRIIKNIA